ncbi:Lrp/AsnC ligand binding domain-containing protein [Actinobaculum sp. 313]|uniref:Lrp/AsnC ligand binding domain-containing protein n=1 Tax=Actinobaculum sp. 313 TaxID=2495645 RepID=UPI001F0C8526|nr:Lrp/AsnC ligand binding domain-containing protein [Actinobaculum sp. 313]
MAEQIASTPGVAEVYSVTGDTDIVALVRVKQHEDLASVIPDAIGKIPGVKRLRTYLAFREFSQGDLDAAYNLGLD